MVSMLDSAPLLVIISIIVGYMFGSLPLAYRISRSRGVDIFSTGTGLAGATNVRRTLNVYVAAVVLLGDVGKGIMAIVCGRLLGVDDAWIILTAMATVVGHWHSVFTGFRGGDGLAVLGGLAIALFSVYGFIAAAAAAAVSLGAQRMPITSLLGIVFGYATLAALGYRYDLDPLLTLGMGVVSAMVLARAIRSNVAGRQQQEAEETPESESLLEGSSEGVTRGERR